MPAFSCFTAFGFLEFSSEPSEAEKQYRNLLNGYRDPVSGQATIDTTIDTHKEAVIFGQANAIAAAKVTLRRAGNELRAETSYTQLEEHEERFQVSPAPTDTVVQRRAALAAKQKAARGPRFEAVWEALGAILGSDLVAYRPITIAEAEAYPSDPGATDAPGLFRRSDAVAKSVRLLGAITRVNGVSGVYSETNQDTTHPLQDTVGFNFSAAGQSFTGNGRKLKGARWYLKKTGSPTGTAVAKIYAHSGTYGTSGVPTGAALATSDTFDVSTLTTSLALTSFSFSGAAQITLAEGTHYVAVVEYSSGSGGNTVDYGADNSSPSHEGNASAFFSGSWNVPSDHYCFYVDTNAVMEVSYENWNRSLVETVLVPGDVICVDPGNWGLAEKVTIVASAGSGTTRTLTAVFTKPHSADTYATTGTTPLWSNTKRHVLIVVKAAAAIDPATVRRVHALMASTMRGPTTWAIVEPTTPGAGTVGPFVIGSTSGSPLGAVPVESITV